MAKAGRARIIKNPTEFNRKAEEYFAGCQSDGKRPLWSGLAYYLGFSSRQSLLDYAKRPEFSYVVKRAHLRLEMDAEEQLSSGNTTAAIFRLKQFDWSDKSAVDHTSSDGTMATCHSPIEVMAELLRRKQEGQEK